MADVYRNSALNICAYGKTLQSGCVQPREPLCWSPCLLTVSDDLALMASNRPDALWTLHELEILQRGWIFQERLLSVRTVYLGDHEMLFECCGGTFSEQYPLRFEKQQRIDSFERGEICKSFLAQTITAAKSLGDGGVLPDSLDYRTFYAKWAKVVALFSATTLSYASDRLAAIAAIAATFKDASSAHYVAGHFLEDLPSSLLWFHRGDYLGILHVVPLAQRWPSWSWASIDSDVYFHTPVCCYEARGPGSAKYALAAKIIDCQVTEVQGRVAVLGEVETARLRIEGVVHRVSSWDYGQVDSRREGARLRISGCPLEYGTGRSCADMSKVYLVDHLSSDTELLFLPIMRSEIYGYNRSMYEAGLLLAPHLDGYYRVGYLDTNQGEHIVTNIYTTPFWGEGVHKEILLY